MHNSKKHVLLVEDEPSLTISCSKKLKAAGCDVSIAGSVNEALASIEENIPDVILLDIIMPGEPGLHLLGTLKKRKEWKDIPVIMLTNLDSKEKEARDLGAIDYVIKSNISVDDLVKKVLAVIE